jgi:negative regulator of flagellin synthesis FlgM
MKIGNNLDSSQIDAVNRASNASRTPTAQSTAAGGVSAVAPTDRVQLSATSQSLAATDAAAATVRADKVAEVREAIENGRFRVNPHVVADRMITAASELLETMIVGGARQP